MASEIYKQWRTAEINPYEIAEVLHGNLVDSNDSDSLWDIELFYRRKLLPEMVVKCHPPRRNIFLAINGFRSREYLATIKLTDIEDILFVQYQEDERIEADMVVNVRDNGSGLIRAGMIISSKSHITFM